MTVWIESNPWDQTPAMILVCPTCGDEFQRLGTVREVVRPGGEDGRTPPSDADPSPRRTAVVVDVEGACGHRWRLQMVLDNGQTSCTALAMDDGSTP